MPLSTIESALVQAFALMLGVAALHVFFNAVEVRWPRSYFSLGDVAAQKVAAGPWRYVAFRTAPVFAVAFFLAGALANLGYPGLFAAVGSGFLHALATNGRAAVRLRTHRGAFGYWPLFIGHAIASLTSVLVSFAGWFAARSDLLIATLPTLETLSATLWTGVIAAVLGAYVVQAANRGQPNPEALVRKSRRTISEELWNAAEREALANQLEPAVVRAILLVENLQRPGWIRRLENLKGRVFRPGTYGVMQVYASGPISDLESIHIACTGYLREAANSPAHDGENPWERVERLARAHNPDTAFVELVQAFHFQLTYSSAGY